MKKYIAHNNKYYETEAERDLVNIRLQILDVIFDFIDKINYEKIGDDEWMDMYIKHMIKQYDQGSYRLCMKIYGLACIHLARIKK